MIAHPTPRSNIHLIPCCHFLQPQESNARLRNDLDATAAQCCQLEERLASSSALSASLHADLESSRARCSQLEGQVTVSAPRPVELLAELAASQSAAERLRLELDATTLRLQTSETARSKSSSARTLAEEARDKLETKLEQAFGREKKLKDQLDEVGGGQVAKAA